MAELRVEPEDFCIVKVLKLISFPETYQRPRDGSGTKRNKLLGLGMLDPES